MKEIELKFKGEIIKGILLKEDDKYLSIKLSNGYNSILKKEEVQIISLNDLSNKKNNFISKRNKSSNKVNIKIIHTGGTIASKVDYKTGAVSSKFTPEEILNLFPDLLDKCDLDVELIGNLFSEDMRFSHYNLMLRKIEETILNGGYEGVIISHGTDTLHYTSAALQYGLENLSIPIILVGAQRSSDRPSSDAFSNLNAAIDFIIDNSKKKEQFLRVGICMHESISDNNFLIFDSINLKKLHSTRRDAFKQINYLPFARINYVRDNFEIEILRKEFLKSKSNKKLKVNKYDENLKLGFFKTHPNLFPEEIKNLNIYDGIVIEGTGLGHLGINEIDDNTKVHNENYLELKKLSNQIPVVVGTQTIYGETNLNVYSTGRRLQELDIFGNLMNLTTETLFIRLGYCLSNSKEDFKSIWNSNLEEFELNSKEL